MQRFDIVGIIEEPFPLGLYKAEILLTKTSPRPGVQIPGAAKSLSPAGFEPAT